MDLICVCVCVCVRVQGKLIDAHKKLVDEAMEHSQALENKDKSMQEAEEKHKRLAKEHAALQVRTHTHTHTHNPQPILTPAYLLSF